MEQTFNWMATSSSASQGSTCTCICILWNPKVHFHVNNPAPLVPLMSQFNPIRATSPPLSLNVQIPSVPVSSMCPLSLRFLHQNHALTSLVAHTCHLPCPFVSDMISPIIFCRKCKFWSCTLCICYMPNDINYILQNRLLFDTNHSLHW